MIRNAQDELNRSMPAAAHVKLGDLLNDLVTALNAHTAALKALSAKLDADAGVTDTNYTSSVTASLASLKTLADRASS